MEPSVNWSAMSSVDLTRNAVVIVRNNIGVGNFEGGMAGAGMAFMVLYFLDGSNMNLGSVVLNRLGNHFMDSVHWLNVMDRLCHNFMHWLNLHNLMNWGSM